MIIYATFLRALAAILITNSHYTGVYPIELIANGGLLGDILFFALSGFVLVNIKGNFVKWYKKRILRIYPSIWIITAIYLLLGFYTFERWSLVSYFIYPTYYHFIASIVVLYIPYYIVVKSKYLYKRILFIMLFTFIIQLVVYILFYDKSYYHIDAVREPMIRFLFFQSMLLGLYFRQNHKKYVDSNKIMSWILLILSTGIYFMTKIVFSRIDALNQYQIINQITVFIVLYFMFKCFAGVNSHLEKMPGLIKLPADFIAKITLQIYAVQYVIIPNLAYLVFPINWVIITTTIIISAYMLYIVGTKASELLEGFIDDLVLKTRRKGLDNL